MIFTPDEIRLIRRLAKTHTAQQIAEMTGRSRRSVANKAFDLGISMKKHGDNHYNVKYSDEDVELARQLHEAGLGVREIAEKMEIPQDHLSNILYFRKRKPA
ncbi:MAG: DNA-binding protein [Siphoviridae sp. ctdc_1]|nr:MAG: DNA-binding protein [Siphoviridae sp. ctdc_1]